MANKVLVGPSGRFSDFSPTDSLKPQGICSWICVFRCADEQRLRSAHKCMPPALALSGSERTWRKCGNRLQGRNGVKHRRKGRFAQCARAWR